MYKLFCRFMLVINIGLSLPFIVLYFILHYIFRLSKLSQLYLNLLRIVFSKIYVQVFISRSVIIRGLEKIYTLNEDKPICLMGNHQSGFDIMLLLGYLPFTPRFLAKKELLWQSPIINLWMLALECIFISRTNNHQTFLKLKKLKNNPKQNPLILFPEGTRSRSVNLNPFRKGIFKIPIWMDAVIVPFTINGAHKVYQKKMKKIDIYITFDDPIYISKMNRQEQSQVPDTVKNIFEKNLKATS